MKIGKVCAKHPELLGERDDSSACRACRAERTALWGVKYRADNAAAIAERRAAYYAKNRDKELETARRHRADNAAALPALRAAYYAKNAETLNAKKRQYRADNAALVAARSKAYYTANRDTLLARMQKYREANKDAARRYRAKNSAAAREHVMRRRASKRSATPAWANEFFIQEAYALAQLREKVCGGKWHVDHIVPLRSKLVCGLHVEHNLAVVPAALNLSKHNRYWPDMPEVPSGMDLA